MPGPGIELIGAGEIAEVLEVLNSRYLSRFLGKYDAVVTNGPALEKRLTARGVHIDKAMPLGIERGHFSSDYRSETLRAAPRMLSLRSHPLAHTATTHETHRLLLRLLRSGHQRSY